MSISIDGTSDGRSDAQINRALSSRVEIADNYNLNDKKWQLN